MKALYFVCRLPLVLIAAWGTLAVCGAQDIPPVRIMPFGDSITQGCCIDTQGGYRKELYALLSNSGFNVDFVGTQADTDPAVPDPDHEGHPGYGIEDLRNGLPLWTKQVADPDIILLHAGTVDFWLGRSLAATQDRLKNLLADLSALRPHAKIIVASLIPRNDEYETIQESYNSSLPGIVSEQVALGRQVYFVDLHGAPGSANQLLPEDFIADGVHPRLSGYVKMAALWLPGITSVITPNGTTAPPAIARVDARTDLTQVTVTFSKPIRDGDVIPANFSLSGGLSISAANLDAVSKRIVTLTTSGQTCSTIYTLSVSGIHDRMLVANQIASGSAMSFTSQTVIDGSFETGGTAWTSSGNVAVTNSSIPPATDGQKLLMFHSAGTLADGVISQSIPTTPGQKYRLQFDMGVYAFNTSAQRLQVTVTGNSVLYSQTETLNGLGGGATRWQVMSLEFVADSAITTLLFQDVSIVTSSIELLLDDVRLSAVITWPLAVNSSPSGGVSVAASPLDVDGNGPGATGFTRSYQDGATVTVTAPANSGAFLFSEWQANGVTHATTPAVTVTMTTSNSLTAAYVLSPIPVAPADAYTTNKNTELDVPATQGVLANDADPASLALTAVLETVPAHGTLTFNADGSFTYLPATDFTGADAFTYHATNGTSASAAATVSIAVSPIRSFVNGGFELGTPADLGPLDGWTVSGDIDFMPVGYTSSPSGFVPVYTPSEGVRMAVFSSGSNDFNGNISQSFSTTPGHHYILGLDMGIVTNVTGRKQRLQVAVSGGNTLLSQREEIVSPGAFSFWAPKRYLFLADSMTTTLTLSDASGTLLANQTLNTDLLLDNVRLNEAVTLTVNSSMSSGVSMAVSPPDAGGNGNGVTGFARYYLQGTAVTLATPASSGAFLFAGWQENGVTFATLPTVTVTMNTSRNLTAVYVKSTIPVALADAYSTDEDTALTVPAPGVLANDSEPNSLPLTAVLDLKPASGTLVLDASGGFTYTPATHFSGTASFTYHASNGPASSGPVTVVITINPVGPFTNGGFELGTPADFGSLDGWTVSGNPGYQPVGFTSTAPGFTPVFTPSEGSRMAVFSSGSNDFSGSISQKFATIPGKMYFITLDMGIVAATAGYKQRLQVAVNGATPLLSQQEEITSAGPFSFWVPKSYTIVADSAATTLTLSDASSSLPPSQSQNTDLLLDNVQVTAAVALTVNASLAGGVNVAASPPDANGLGGGVTGFIRHYSHGTTVTLTTPATSGAYLFVDWQKNGVTYAPTPTTAATINADSTLTAVYALSTTPVAYADAYSAYENVTQVVPPPGVLANDFDPNSQSLTAVLDQGPAHGALSLNADGGFGYTPEPGFSGTDSFTYHASNGTASSAPVTVSIVINPLGPFTNGGFEQGNPADFGSLDGWTVSGNPGNQPVGFTSTGPGIVPVYSPSEGSRMAVFSSGNDDFSGSISQTFSTIPGQTYVLALDMGIVSDTAGSKQRLQVAVRGATLLLSQQEEIISPGTFTFWAPKSYTFIADSAATTLTLSDASATLLLSQARHTDLLLDNVQVTAAVALTVSASLAGGVNVAASPPDVNGNGNGVTEFTRHYIHGTTVTLTAPSILGAYLFVDWLENGVTYATTPTTTVTINAARALTAVYALDTTPVAHADAYSAYENVTRVVPAPGVLANDFDPLSQPLTAVLDQEPAHGTLSLNADGGFGYTPEPGFSGTDSFTYHASNGTASSAPVTVSIVINPVGPFTNGGFELGAPADFGSLDGWTVSGNPGNQPVGFTSTGPGIVPAFSPSEGNRMAVFSSGNDDFSGSISQTFSTIPGQTYVLALDMGIVSDTAGSKQRLQVAVRGATLLLSQQEEIISPGTFTFWAPKSYTFIADSAATTLTLSDASATLLLSQARDTDLLLDNVQVYPRYGFSYWMSGLGLTAGPETDSDGDSISNAVEFVIGGNPVNSMDVNLLPAVSLVTADLMGNSINTDYLLFTYRRTNMAKIDPSTTIKVEWTADLLGPWEDANGTAGVVTREEIGAAGVGVDLVEVYIPRSLSLTGKLFARLGVAVTMP